MNRKCWISWYLSHLLAASASSMRVNESCLMLWMKLISSLGNQVVLLLMQIILFWLSLPCTYYKTVFWKTSSNSSYSLLILVKWTRPLVETTENPARLSATSVWRSTFHTSALKRTKIIQQKNSYLLFWGSCGSVEDFVCGSRRSGWSGVRVAEWLRSSGSGRDHPFVLVSNRRIRV